MPRRLRYEVEVDSTKAVSGATRAERAIDGIGREADQARTRVRNFGTGIDRLGQRASRARTGLASLGAGIAALATGATANVIRKIITESSELGATLVESASAAGLTVKELEEVRRVLSEDGAQIDQVDRLLVKLNANLSRAADGNAEFARAFAALGVDIQDAEGRIISASDALDRLNRNITTDNFATAAGNIQVLAGEEGLLLLSTALQRSSEEWEAARGRVDALNLSLADQADDLKDLAQSLSDIRDRFRVALAREVGTNADAIADAVERLADEVALPRC